MFELAELYGTLRNGILKFSDVLSIGDGYAECLQTRVVFLSSGETARQSKPTLNFKLQPCMGPSNANILIWE